MKRIGYLLLFFAFINNSITAEDYTTNYDLIFKAEKLISTGQYGLAVEIYEKIFKIQTNISHVELNNACLCYIKLKKFNEAIALCDSLVLKGYRLEDFDKEWFAAIRGAEQWNSFANERYPVLREAYCKIVDWDYRTKLLNVIRNDQTVSLKYNAKISDSTYYAQMVMLFELFDQYGFPRCFLQKDSLSTKLITAFRHYFGLYHRFDEKDNRLYKFSKYNLEEKLINAIKQGLLSPHILQFTYNWSEMGNKYGEITVKVSIKEQTLVLIGLNPTQISSINKQRSNVLLPQITMGYIDTLAYNAKKNMPFNEIYDAIKKCTTCKNNSDFISLIYELKESNQKSPISGFLLKTLPEITTWFYPEDFTKF